MTVLNDGQIEHIRCSPGKTLDAKNLIDTLDAKALPDIREIAIAIGYHFWHVKSDAEAERAGMDAAKDVMKRLR